MELISMIVPVYNVAPYLRTCLDSVLNQDYTNIEVVLVEDGSTDGSRDICQEYLKRDTRVKMYANCGKGISAARNTGIERATGDYVVMVDSDDYIAPFMVSTLYQMMQQSCADMAICDFVRGTERSYVFVNTTQNAELIDGKEALRRIYLDDHNKLQYVVPWAKLYKKTLFHGIEYPDGMIFEDIHTTHKLLIQCRKIAVVNVPMVYYFKRNDSIMNQTFHVGKLDYLPALEKRIAFFHKENMPDLEKKAYDELLHMLIWEYSRVRDILHNKKLLGELVKTYRKYYQKGYVSSYQTDTKAILRLFSIHPEFVVLYWKIKGKLGLV